MTTPTVPTVIFKQEGVDCAVCSRPAYALAIYEDRRLVHHMNRTHRPCVVS